MRVVFMHIPKTAGLAISNCLNEQIEVYGHDWRRPSYVPLPYYIEYLKWSSLPVPAVFSFVRNPLDRLWSAYNYLLNGGINEVDKLEGERYLSGYDDFNDFILNGLCSAINLPHIRPQWHYLYMDGKCYADSIGHYESLEKDLRGICDRFRLTMGDLTTVNKTEKGEMPELNKKAKSIIKTLYKFDYKLFGYETL